MAKHKFAARLYEYEEDIHARFRAHQSTILQLSACYRVGQETMRLFLMQTLKEEYREIVMELRQKISLNTHQAAVFGRHEMPGREPIRTMDDYSPAELDEIKSRITERRREINVVYHPFVVNSLVGDR